MGTEIGNILRLLRWSNTVQYDKVFRRLKHLNLNLWSDACYKKLPEISFHRSRQNALLKVLKCYVKDCAI